MNIKFWSAIATITGGTIGAGILAIPYVINKSGFWTGLLSLIIIGIAFLVINLGLGEIILRTKGNHQLTGYSEIYLGKLGKFLMTLSMIFGIYGAMIAYSIGAAESLNALFGLGSELWIIIFYLIMAFIIYFNLNVLGESELIIGIIKFSVFILLLVFLFNSQNFSFDNFKGLDIKKFFIPYGVLLFSYVGTTALVESKEVLGKNLKPFKNAIILSSIFIIISYILFTLAIIGLNNASNYEIAIKGISRLGYLELTLANIFSLLTMITPFIVLGFGLKEMFIHDYKINQGLSWIFTVIPPAIMLYFVTSFVKVIEITGAITVGLAGVLILLMYQNAKKFGNRKPEYSINIPKTLIFIFLILFIIGSIISII